MVENGAVPGEGISTSTRIIVLLTIKEMGFAGAYVFASVSQLALSKAYEEGYATLKLF
jgi:hypothetical protein